MSNTIPIPSSTDLLKAIDIYLKHAYTGEPSLIVRSQVQSLRNAPDLFANPILVADQHKPPTRFAIRLGNQSYPHMKLVMELAPNNERFLYRADTHDRHVCPSPRSPDYSRFCQLMGDNQKVAEQIETAWEKAGLPTFKAYLKEDLRRRQSIGV